MVDNDGISVRLAAVLCGPGSDAKPKRHVGHGEDDDAIAGFDVVGDAAEAGLEDGVAVEEGHLGGGLEPDLVAGMGSKEVKGMDGETEGAMVGELADAGADAGEAAAGNVGCATDEGLAGIVYAVLVEAEAVVARRIVGALHGGALHNMFQIGTGELEELLEHRRRLLLVQRPHASRLGRV